MKEKSISIWYRYKCAINLLQTYKIINALRETPDKWSSSILEKEKQPIYIYIYMPTTILFPQGNKGDKQKENLTANPSGALGFTLTF